MLLASAAPAHHPNSDASSGTGSGHGARPLVPVLAPPKVLPAGWPIKQADPVWSWLACHRAPLPIIVAGAEGGVGTSTVAALIGETLAAGSPGPTMLLDQCGSTWGSLSRRLLGQRGGLPGDQARSMLRQGIPGPRVLGAAPTSSAGAAVLADGAAYAPLRELFGLVQTACGAMVIDGGSVNLVLAARRDVHPVLVVIGRADVIGAEAVCAALGFVSRYTTAPPVVVLSSPTPGHRRHAQAARKLVATTGVVHLVDLPYDPQLATATALRLDRACKATASTCLRVITAIRKTQEVSDHGR